MSIYSITIHNYKSIRLLEDFRLKDINVFIGSNGVGKSNLISFFKLVNNIINKNLQVYINTTGKANSYLYFGQKNSPSLGGEIQFRNKNGTPSNSYEFQLLPTQEGGLIFGDEFSWYNGGSEASPKWNSKRFTPPGSPESFIPDSDSFRNSYLKSFFKTLRIFHFHDTSQTALVKGFCNVNDIGYLKADASNLAAFLFSIKNNSPKYFRMIESTIESIAPFFNGFDLAPNNQGEINLKWLEKGSDNYFDANHLSDGTLRFICLATLLLQPAPPDTIIIDEPELGLHPAAIDKLAGLIKGASLKAQIIISTQSVNLLNNFELENLVIVEREDNQSVFKRLSEDEFSTWIEEYSLGDLWDKNVLGGRP